MTKQECLTAIQTFGQADLLELWVSIKNRTTEEKGWPPGLAFEHLVLRAFQLERADVVWSFEVNLLDEKIEQIDGVVHLKNSVISILIESKDYQEKINVEPLAKMKNQLQRRPSGVIGAVFSVNGFTSPALMLAQFMAPQTILLWNQQDIDHCLRTSTFTKGFFKKYWHCVENGKPDYNLAPPIIL